MRFFVTKDLNKNSALKLIILFSLIFFLGLIVTNFLFMYKIGFTPSQVTSYYLGNPEIFKQPKSYGSLVEETQAPTQPFNKQSKLHNRYIFDNFIEGNGNQFAKAAAISVAENPGQTPFNPLLIYSSPGLGKTHLIQAVSYTHLTLPTNREV